jgi:hypothetical protein
MLNSTVKLAKRPSHMSSSSRGRGNTSVVKECLKAERTGRKEAAVCSGMMFKTACTCLFRAFGSSYVRPTEQTGAPCARRPHDRSLSSRLNTVAPHVLKTALPCLASRSWLLRSLARPVQTTRESAITERHASLTLLDLAKDQRLARNATTISSQYRKHGDRKFFPSPITHHTLSTEPSNKPTPKTDRLLRSNNRNLPPAPRSPHAQRLHRLPRPQHRPDNPRLDPRRHPRLVRDRRRSRSAKKTPVLFVFTFTASLTPSLERAPQPPQPQPPPPQLVFPFPRREPQPPSPRRTWIRTKSHGTPPRAACEEELRQTCLR